MDNKVIFNQRKEMIRNMIYDQNYIPMKIKEMAYLMGVPHEDRGELKAVLDALVLEGSVECTKKGKYIKSENKNLTGTFVGNARGFGFVEVEGQSEDIFIPAAYVNGAFHHDIVRVKVSPSKNKEGRRQEGMILKILQRGTKTLVGTFQKNKSFGFVVPDDDHFGKDIFISKKHTNDAEDGDKVTVKILEYGSEKKKPEGEVLEILGQADDPATDVTAVIKGYGIEEEFPKKVIREVKSISQIIPPEEVVGRKDYRNLLTVTIDGEDARDLDDAISIEKRGKGYRLFVHIADVAHYVAENSPLDAEAKERGTSVYLADRVIPMLPRELSNGICSLNEGEDRLTLTCVMDFDEKGNVADHQITESIICVDQRMSYTGVTAILSGEEHREGKREDIRSMCFLMREAAGVLKQKRKIRGAIDFDFPESKIILDEKGYPKEIYPYERNVATDIIEDFMLLANETVAEDFFWQEVPFLYRVHESPESKKIKQLEAFIKNFGYYMKTGREQFHPKEVQKLLFSLEGETEEALISRLVLRSMQRAKYSVLNIGHFGLSTQYYTHFTSPIRRYPDLQIHRIIKEGLHSKLRQKRLEHYDTILPSVAEHSSKMERRAQDAERDVEKIKKVEYMQRHIGETYQGVISGVTSWGFFVELNNTVEGLVSIYSLEDDDYSFREEEYMLIGRESGRTFRIGQKAEIVVADASKKNKTIDFILKEFAEEFLEEFAEEEDEQDSKNPFVINEWLDDDEAERLMGLYQNQKKGK